MKKVHCKLSWFDFISALPLDASADLKHAEISGEVCKHHAQTESGGVRALRDVNL
jgi:hypothetical protein